jgi:RNA 2',3'-cyclic 3'-phosphodiesterase
MRLFVALDIDPEIRRRIAEFRDKLRPYAPDVRWVGAETFHITVQFLGETAKLEEIRAALQQVRGAAIPLNFRGTGFFPTPKSPRVFWVGIESDETLQELATAIGEVLNPLGFQRDIGRYKPHLTLARAGSGRPRPVGGERSASGLRVVGLKLQEVEATDFGAMKAREFCLYESNLSSSGAKYTALNGYPLNDSSAVI